MRELSPTSLRLAGKCAAQAAAFDRTISRSSEALVRAWAAQLEGTDLTEQELEEAVLTVYRQPERPFNPIASIIQAAESRKVRRAVVEQRSRPPVAPSPGPVMPAFQSTGAIDVECPRCRVAPGAVCVHDGGEARKLPCFDRIMEARKVRT